MIVLLRHSVFFYGTSHCKSKHNSIINVTFTGAFSLYDIDKDGKITKEEMTNIVKAIFEMVGDKMGECEESPESRVNLIFTLMDTVSSEKV